MPVGSNRHSGCVFCLLLPARSEDHDQHATQREAYLAASPHNIVHLTLPESEEASAADLAAWRRDGILVQDAEPALWWLEQEFTGPDGVARTRTGIVAKEIGRAHV